MLEKKQKTRYQNAQSRFQPRTSHGHNPVPLQHFRFILLKISKLNSCFYINIYFSVQWVNGTQTERERERVERKTKR